MTAPRGFRFPCLAGKFNKRMRNIFLKMSDERDSGVKKIARGISFDDARPLSMRARALWRMAKRKRDRSSKPQIHRASEMVLP
jgi:hypothetical protein